MYTNHKKVEYDIQHFLKNPKDLKEIDKRKFIEKYFVITFMPFILSIILSLLLILVGLHNFLDIGLMLPIVFIVCLFFCVVEYLSFDQIFKQYPEFAYVYFLAKSDTERKKDFSYDKAVQKLYNQLIKRRKIARKRLKYKVFIGIPAFAVILMMVLLGQPKASPVIIGVAIIFIIYFIIDLIMSFGGKGD